MYNHVIFFYYKFEVSLLGQQKIKEESSFSFFLVFESLVKSFSEEISENIWLYYWGKSTGPVSLLPKAVLVTSHVLGDPGKTRNI